ncbi:hypothetical protein Pelo_16634 [Pelomyxa schiedti]|nr:hypothetical protein Pelo_16634 [Pelomyxa schiedti]
MELVDEVKGAALSLTAKSQILALLVASTTSSRLRARPSPGSGASKGPTIGTHNGCHAGLLPPHLLAESIGQRWVLRPARNLLVTFSWDPLHPSNTGQDQVFVSLSHTHGVVRGPTKVLTLPRLVGWLGGHTVVTQDNTLDWATVHSFDLWDLSKRTRSELGVRGPTACCNTKWVVVVGGPGNPRGGREADKPCGLNVRRVRDCGMAQPPWNVATWPWLRDLVSIGFFGSSEYDFESDVVEAIYTEKSGSSKYLCVSHIDLNAESPAESTAESPSEYSDFPMQYRVVGRCNISKLGIKVKELTKPLVVNRSIADGPLQQSQYYFLLPKHHHHKSERVLVLSTGKRRNLFCSNEDEALQVVDESHLCTISTTKDSSVVSVYPLAELVSSSASHHHAAAPCQVHNFPTRSVMTIGCGIIISSSLTMSTPQTTKSKPSPKRPRLSQQQPGATPAGGFTPPQVEAVHSFTDATSGAVMLSMKQSDRVFLPTSIQAVPFTSAL